MVCPICHKNTANKIVVRRFGGAVVQGNVCEECVEKAESLDSQGFYYIFFTQPQKQCRYCGRRLMEIEESLLVGCPNCYNEFGKELQPIINRLQGKN